MPTASQSQRRVPAGDTRETPAIDVCKGLLEEGAKLRIYDPKVTEAQARSAAALCLLVLFGCLSECSPINGGQACCPCC